MENKTITSPIEIFDNKKFWTNTVIQTKDGLAKIIEYINYDNIKIHFLNSDVIKYTRLNKIKSKTVRGFNTIDNESIHNVIAREKYNNKIFINNNNEKYIVRDYIDSENIIIEFLIDDERYNGCLDGPKISKTYLSLIKNGKVKNPYRFIKNGGFIGEGIDTSNTKYGKKIYDTWRNILYRTNNNNQVYKNTCLCVEWRNFQNFANWYIDIIDRLNQKFKYTVDKDFKQIGIIEKIYSPYTCMIIPVELNNSIIGLRNNKLDKNNNLLPVGVRQHKNGLYYAKAKDYTDLSNNKNDKIICSYIDDPYKAFKIYHDYRINHIRKLATYYFNNNGILIDDYNFIINNFDILPFN